MNTDLHTWIPQKKSEEVHSQNFNAEVYQADHSQFVCTDPMEALQWQIMASGVWRPF